MNYISLYSELIKRAIRGGLQRAAVYYYALGALLWCFRWLIKMSYARCFKFWSRLPKQAMVPKHSKVENSHYIERKMSDLCGKESQCKNPIKNNGT